MIKNDVHIITDQEKLNLLVEFGKQVASETNLDNLLLLTAKQITKIIGAKRCMIFIRDEQRGELWSKIARGKGLRYTEIHLPIKGNSIAAYCARTGETINLPDVYADGRFSKELDLITGFKTNSLLAVPLTNKEGKAVGVFQLNNKTDNTPFDKRDEGLLKLMSNLASGNIEIAQLYEEVKLSNLETIYRLAITAEYRDQQDTKVHLLNISHICEEVSKSLGLSAKDVENIRDASLLHDIGKVAIPDHILLKPGKLTPDEYSTMKTHTTYGGRILKGAKSKILETAYRMSLYHHERFDGSGYPFGLKGEDIPLEARIVSVADVFDALCMSRVYKKAWAVETAYDYMLEQAGTEFDPQIIEAFKKAYPNIAKLYSGVETAVKNAA
ncbi:MAG: HD domain-containing protein [Elusimicrobiota bacterium]|jgi:HD-GYP domain-containing protein (c-di-GMP phosphodiesterase class II)|nr:HD domain-containing protein [Elusimicrobiota bacterium]